MSGLSSVLHVRASLSFRLCPVLLWCHLDFIGLAASNLRANLDDLRSASHEGPRTSTDLSFVKLQKPVRGQCRFGGV